ncbi:11233_t:CDS:2, partial [Ambispora gerdemannii]
IDNLLTKQTELQNQLNDEQKITRVLQNECQNLSQEKETKRPTFKNYSQEKITHDLAKTQLINAKQSLHDLQEENQQFQSDIDKIIAERDARPDITQTEKVELLQKKAHSLRSELANEKTSHSHTQGQLTSEQLAHGATGTERDNFFNQLTNANLKLTTYENYLKNELKIIDLTDLPTLPAEQSLTDLIIFFNTHSKYDCCNPLHSDYDSLKTRLEQAEADRDQLATKTEELKNQKAQLANDYHKEKQKREKAEQERDNYQQQLSQKEKEIITKFITELKLVDCNENSSPEKVIEIIQQLLINPDANSSDAPFGESLANIKKVDLKMFENLGITTSKELENNIEKVNNYQELADL